MDLKKKLDLLTLVYVISITVSLVTSGWYIIHFRSAFVPFWSDVVRGQQIERALALLRQEEEILEKEPLSDTDPDEYAQIQMSLSAELSQIVDGMTHKLQALNRHVLEEAIVEKEQSARRRFSDPNSPEFAAASKDNQHASEELERLLFGIGGLVVGQRQESMERATSIQNQMVTLLIVNAACKPFSHALRRSISSMSFRWHVTDSLFLF